MVTWNSVYMAAVLGQDEAKGGTLNEEGVARTRYISRDESRRSVRVRLGRQQLAAFH
jgi:hypothetical protein